MIALLLCASLVQDDPRPILEKLGVALKGTERPPWPRPPAGPLEVALVPPAREPGPHLVSFGIPFGPDWLGDDGDLRVLSEGREVAAFTRPLARWGIDGVRGSVRSALVQFEMAFPDGAPRKVAVAWDRPRGASRPAQAQGSKVLALLPPEWLSASLVAWQQVPARENRAAPWYDRHLLEQFPGSIPNHTTTSVEAHLFDRPGTAAKIYVRHGEEEHLRAALQAADFYLQHLGPDGFFDLKKGDHKYVYPEGLAILHFLTGDERYREGVERGLKAWGPYAGYAYKGRGFWTERHTGFGMLAFLHGYELSGEAKHLEQAKKYFEAVWAMQTKPLDGGPPDGAWVHTGESHGDGNGWTTSPWMSCFLTDAIWKYWMLSGDPRAPASLAMYAKFAERHAVTADGRGVWYMANSPGRGRSDNAESPPHNMEGAYLMALGHWLSGGADPSFAKKVETLWPPLMKDGANRPGRKFTWRFRETSMLVWFLENAGTVR